MTLQRKRGVPLTVYKRKLVTDNRGNETLAVDLADSTSESGWVIPQRSSRAEVPGQQQIDIVRIGVRDHIEDVGMWSIVDMLGDSWDVVAPPAYHHGSSRHVRHWSIDLRRRP